MVRGLWRSSGVHTFHVVLASVLCGLSVVFLAAFALLLGLRRRRQRSGGNVGGMGRSGQPCRDFNASCATPCPACVRWSRDGCARCRMMNRPLCRAADDNRTTTSLQHRRPVRWLHFPKCGATLAVSIISYACADTVPAWHVVGMALRGGRVDVRMAHAVGGRHRAHGARCGGRLLLPFDGHQPVSPRDAADGLVAMFRRPSQRLISAYLDNYHTWGLPRAERARIKLTAPTIASFARHPGVAGCFTKMLTGHHCAAHVDLRDGSIVREALAVLRSGRFAFVGLVEEWAASVCLLHRMLPGDSTPLLAEFRQLGHSINSHRGIGAPAGERARARASPSSAMPDVRALHARALGARAHGLMVGPW